MMEYVRAAPVTRSIFPSRIFWALLHTIADDDHGAAALAELRSAAHLHAWPVFGSVVDIIEAVALGRDGRREEANATYAAAIERLDLRLVPGLMHYFRLVAAEAAIRDGWGSPASELRAAEAFFAARGFGRIVRRCRGLLAAAGAPVPRRGRGDSVVPERLRALGVTSRELDVLNLVADGLTNREIADRLFLSPKTVERHLTSLFTRTSCRARVELAELLGSVAPEP